MTERLIFRPARESDCDEIAALYQISSDGVADYIWTTLARPGEDLLEVGRRRYARRDTNFSFENCTIVESCSEQDGAGGEESTETVAMLVAFPMHVDPLYEESDPILRPYSELEEDDSYYVCGVAVKDEWRGRGIGSQLMAQAEVDCRNRGFDKLSLLVFDQNRGAKSLYDRLGYQVRGWREVVPHPLIHYDGEILLMVKTLGRNSHFISGMQTGAE